MAASTYVKPLSTHFQRELPSPLFQSTSPFPGVYAPREVSGSAISTIEKLADEGSLRSLLKAHGGAVVFRGFDVATEHDFSKFAFSAKLGIPHEEVGRPPRRTVLAPNVVTANEGPPTAPIWHHNEYGWSTIHPTYLIFYCLVPAETGGETPLNSSIELAAALEREVPEFYRKLKEKGGLYTYRYTKDSVVTSNSGASVLEAYGKDVLATDSEAEQRRKVEEEVRRHSQRFEWHENGDLSVYHVVPVIRTHRGTGLTTFFGNLISAYGRSKHHGALKPPYLGDDGGFHPLPTFGDGETIPVDWLETADRIVHETRILLEWQQGDVVIFDNHIVQHAREPWTGTRRVLASMWDDEKFPDEVNIKYP